MPKPLNPVVILKIWEVAHRIFRARVKTKQGIELFYVFLCKNGSYGFSRTLPEAVEARGKMFC